MGIFSNKKKYATVSGEGKKGIKKPEIKGSMLWEKCHGCGEIIYKKDIENNKKTCPKCDNYFKMKASERVDLLIDEETFVEYDEEIFTNDPLNFPDYQNKLEAARAKTGLSDGVIEGIGCVEGIRVSLAVMEFEFIGGSMGTVVGDKITKAIERGMEEKIPVVIVSTSGGARMHEGISSLMQMAKTSVALERLRGKGIPFISIPVSPTAGGVTASFAMLGDVIITEPKALICFAGPRVIENTIKQKLPEGFQKAEFLLEHGMIDIISERKNLKSTLAKILRNLGFNKEVN